MRHCCEGKISSTISNWKGKAVHATENALIVKNIDYAVFEWIVRGTAMYLKISFSEAKD